MKSPFNFFRDSSDGQRILQLKGLSLFKALTRRQLRELEELLHLSVVMLFLGAAVAGPAGLLLVLPVTGVVAVIIESLRQILSDQRLLGPFPVHDQLLASNSALNKDPQRQVSGPESPLDSQGRC